MHIFLGPAGFSLVIIRYLTCNVRLIHIMTRRRPALSCINSARLLLLHFLRVHRSRSMHFARTGQPDPPNWRPPNRRRLVFPTSIYGVGARNTLTLRDLCTSRISRGLSIFPLRKLPRTGLHDPRTPTRRPGASVPPHSSCIGTRTRCRRTGRYVPRPRPRRRCALQQTRCRRWRGGVRGPAMRSGE